MSDNVQITSGSGTYVATDDVGGVQYQRVKLAQGADGSATDVSSSAPLQVTLANTGANATALNVTVSSAAVTQSGTWTVQPGNTANTTAWLVTGTGGTFPATVAAGATNIAKAEDVASADADVGVPAMAVRKATPANTSGTDGDYEMLQMSSGRLWVDASGVTLTVGSHAVTNAGTFAVQTAGDVAHDAVDSGSPVKVGAYAITSLPTAVANADRTNLIADKFGRVVNIPVTIRDLVGTQTTTISASTSETTIVTAAASVFNDLVMLIVSNTSSATNTRIDFRDTTAGSVLFSIQSNGGQPPVGFVLPTPIPQTSVNTNWTAQCATSTTDIRIYAVFAKNR